MTRFWAQARLVARQDFVDYIRDRRALRGLLLQPLIFGLALGLPLILSLGSMNEYADDKSRFTVRPMTADFLPEQEELTVAVAERMASHPVVAQLKAAGADTTIVGSPRDAVADGDADAGVSLAAGDRINLVVASGDKGRSAARVVDLAITRYNEATLREQLHQTGTAEAGTVASISVVTERRDEPNDTRSSISFVPVFVVFPFSQLVWIAIERLAGAKDRRVIEPLLVLPLDRRAILAGKGISTLGIGSITLAGVLVPMLGGLAWWSIAGRSAGVGTLIATAVSCAVCVIVFFIATGLLLGSYARSAGEASTYTRVLTFGIPVVVFGSIALRRLEWVVPSLLPVPLIGPVLLFQEAMAATVPLTHLAIAVGGTALAAIIAIRWAARLLAEDQSILRPT